MKKLEGKGFSILAVRDLVRQYDNLAKGSGSFERVGDSVFVKGSGSFERAGNGLVHEGYFADSDRIANMGGNRHSHDPSGAIDDSFDSRSNGDDNRQQRRQQQNDDRRPQTSQSMASSGSPQQAPAGPSKQRTRAPAKPR